jgi:hypothetical protein
MFFQSIIQTLLSVFHYYTPKEFEIKETTVSAPFLGIYHQWSASTRLYDCRHDFNFAIIKLSRKTKGSYPEPSISRSSI